MSLSFCVLASGSSGNCTYVSSGSSSVLIDSGLSFRETCNRLEAIGVDPGSIDAVFYTHEHGDHISALGVLHRRLGVGLYANSATVEAIERGLGRGGLPWNIFSAGNAVNIGDLTLEPFSVPHDSYDPVGFIVTGGGSRVAIATDMGMVTTLVRERFRNCAALVLEANHDNQLLRDSSRPWSLKQRIAGPQGHLSNDKAAELVSEVVHAGLRHIVLAHLSEDCNRPNLAIEAVASVLRERGFPGVKICTASREAATELIFV